MIIITIIRALSGLVFGELNGIESGGHDLYCSVFFLFKDIVGLLVLKVSDTISTLGQFISIHILKGLLQFLLILLHFWTGFK